MPRGEGWKSYQAAKKKTEEKNNPHSSRAKKGGKDSQIWQENRQSTPIALGGEEKDGELIK